MLRSELLNPQKFQRVKQLQIKCDSRCTRAIAKVEGSGGKPMICANIVPSKAELDDPALLPRKE